VNQGQKKGDLGKDLGEGRCDSFRTAARGMVRSGFITQKCSSSRFAKVNSSTKLVIVNNKLTIFADFPKLINK
jgi:hypothetical protein